MAKSLLLSVLVDVLGKYVEGLTSENLKLGVFSGKIEFHNLKLKDSALDELNLPIQVKKGSLKKLRVKVPWTQLESKPVEVIIDGVYLLACPLDLSQCTPDISKKMVFASKQQKLQALDDAITMAVGQDHANAGAKSSAQSASYLQQLTTCILDNLEVSLTNVHIRYEDAYSDSGSIFCAGVTLDEILLTTSDDSWNAKFVKRDAATRSSTAIHKIGNINNCGLYWNSNAQSHANMFNADWEEVMQALIYKSKTGFGHCRTLNEETQFMLPPQNNLTIKITHRETCNETTPNVNVIVEISDLPFKADKDQFRQAMLMLKSFGDLDRKRQMALYRPATRPKQHVSARDWWHYAYRLVTGKDMSMKAKVFIKVLLIIAPS
jgi:vacuolar protein sorting-associated protein 13A/C